MNDNRDFTDQSCTDALIDIIKSSATVLGVISGICALLGLVVIFSLWCLCYHPTFGI